MAGHQTWKASTDPDFTAKMRRLLDLYGTLPADGRVLCLDEFGPLNLQPRFGRAWRPQGQPGRPGLPAHVRVVVELDRGRVRRRAVLRPHGTDHRTNAEQDAAIGAYIRWRNQRAKPKTSIATGSKIHHPDYPFKLHDEALVRDEDADAGQRFGHALDP
ncbi:hypothetical protein [Micromonospora endophytica]|uniref:hypothetical protein n=1 Tax=Micromonospora endophytica TaxID=515350 RepID=UPI001C325118|nr:hypothetical protein [Micromonospora endophytica]BCJ56609.1 hypothetical protein Jiend_00310 [Micromonospora endophytica]